MALLQGGSGDLQTGGHAHFEKDLLPPGRTVELPPLPTAPSADNDNPPATNGHTNGHSTINPVESKKGLQTMEYRPLPPFPHTIDFFNDGSLYLIDAPGHLQGHTNLLARIGPGKWKYLAGDACHDPRILTGEREIATWKGERGRVCCIHFDVEETRRTVDRIKDVMGGEVEVVLAHDVEWAEDEGNRGRFWPGTL